MRHTDLRAAVVAGTLVGLFSTILFTKTVLDNRSILLESSENLTAADAAASLSSTTLPEVNTTKAANFTAVTKKMTETKVAVKQNCTENDINEIHGYFLRSLSFFNNQLKEINKGFHSTDHNVKPSSVLNTSIGILIPTTTRKVKCSTLKKFSLFEKSMTSIIKTATEGFLYKLYLGFDKGDVYFETLKKATQSSKSSTYIALIETPGNTFVSAVNEAARIAFEDQVEYFVRVNDDTEFLTSNWAPFGIEMLQKYKPTNIGVVGPDHKGGKKTILTHDMVHRTHIEIFKYYYPPVFQNWWADDWITEVYQPNRSNKLKTWVVKHLLTEMRYKVDPSKKAQLAKETKEGKIKIGDYAKLVENSANSNSTQS